MRGAALVFDNLGINMLSLMGKAPQPSLLYLNRNHGEEIEVELVPVVPEHIWDQGRQGVYTMMEEAIWMFVPRYEKTPGYWPSDQPPALPISMPLCPLR